MGHAMHLASVHINAIELASIGDEPTAVQHDSVKSLQDSVKSIRFRELGTLPYTWWVTVRIWSVYIHMQKSLPLAGIEPATLPLRNTISRESEIAEIR